MGRPRDHRPEDGVGRRARRRRQAGRARGGAGRRLRGGHPREGWDHATGWTRRVLADVWRLDLLVVESEFTLVGVNPALDQFSELAARMRQEAESLARAHGRTLASRRAA
ncbi:MAG TPA: hypothetical protein VFN60_07420 [Acidimicrobiales bacterium]|nr:hypothetical protein [Acidimicrobiales bacterium]